MPFRKIAGLVALVVLLTGCAASKVDANATVRITGVVQNAAGQPAAGANVALFKEADLGELLVGTVLAIGTLGAACFIPQAPPVCGQARKATAAGDGRFAFDLKGSDTQGVVGNANTFDLTAIVPNGHGDGSQAVAVVKFKVQKADLDVPPLRVWDGAVGSTQESGGGTARVRATWPALPPAYGDKPEYSLQFIDAGARRAVWAVQKVTSGVAVDSRLLEDHHGTTEVHAATSRPGPDTTFRFDYLARPAAFSGPGAPPSRRAPCVAQAADGTSTPLAPCKLTDGDLFTSAQSGNSGGGGVKTAVYVDLGAAKPVRLVAARGAIGPITIETSTDAVTWTPAGTGAGSLVDVAPARAPSARYVRVRTTNAVDIGPLSEISIWS